MIEASRFMAAAEAVIRECRMQRRVPGDSQADPNATGLIGLERSPITTSLGNLEAKRTTTNPNFAGLLVSLLNEAGLKDGDAFAVGASGSFPALIIATLSAAKAMGLKPLVIPSLGASEWGANDPSFNWLDMEECLGRAGAPATRPIALAIGGDEDVGRNMSSEGRELLSRRMRESGLPFFEETDLKTNVAARLRYYQEAAGGRPIKAFVNIGGSWANIGTNAEVLKLRPGLLSGVFVPPAEEAGVLQAMAAKGIPVIHLLNVKGLCERYGLPWDPRPLPRPGHGGFYRQIRRGAAVTILNSIGYLAIMALIVVLVKKRDSLKRSSAGA
jgi:poly-gamma-glutamate system protein